MAGRVPEEAGGSRWRASLAASWGVRVADTRRMTMPTAVLFDQDGTLINTFVPAMDAYSKTVGRVITYEDLRPVAHLGAARNLVSALLGHEASDAEDDYFHDVLAEGVATIDLYPGIRELVAALRARGTKVGVVTNSDERSAGIVLGTQGLTPLLDVVVTSDMVDAPKPDPGSMLLALDKLGLPADQVVFVGDSVADMAAARAAGVRAVAAGWGVQVDDITDCDVLCATPADVLDVEV
jgi:HAD superfamily hydrolase (TIGR01509 family)